MPRPTPPGFSAQVHACTQLVAGRYGLDAADLVGRSQRPELSAARHLAMYLLYQTTSATHKHIGVAFAGRDRSTVTDALQVVRGYMDVMPGYDAMVRQLERELKRESAPADTSA